MNPIDERSKDSFKKMKMTLLHRPGGLWQNREIVCLSEKLQNAICRHLEFPEYVVISGHHQEEEVRSICFGSAYTITQVEGADDKRLPFRPFGQ
ncbi:hypothetical protein A2442_03230 [Candidatus Campbellbacteria bacterium RIFOXYC2_FULL_35_25]|uniref:Uncharacterized protein n=1 Tax=Candidatus Campbellbacteria bacterium RIFOXYC2_FULL_35_25 TaxID=1797582 RepID=A0A1F5EJH3_9BACT|nr:MAG: hypothetical protein A2442_03230 [Candidatus Campbellbacteria bacterium RIFOXYC2_FULL_35_25]